MTVTDDDLRIIIIVFSVVCFVLFLISVVLCVSVGFIISKLRHHEKTIVELSDQEYRYIHVQRSGENTLDDGIEENVNGEIRTSGSTRENRPNGGQLHPTSRATGSYGANMAVVIGENASVDGIEGNVSGEIKTVVSTRENRPNVVQQHPTPRATGSYRENVALVIEKETVNVYGNKAPTGQLISIAQNYYKEENKTDTNVPTECIDILDKTANTRLGKSMIFSNDWMGGGVPTSLLFDGGTQHIENIANQNKGIFIHKTVGPEGNTLTISGVKLTIPPNAIRERTLISVGILWDENFVPKLRKKQTLLSPLVLCQPSRLTFDRPVTLSFPHAAVDVKDDWKIKIMKREGNLTNNSNWSQLTEFDGSSILINSEKVELQLNHFTLHTCVGESNYGKVAKKGIHVVAFAGSLTTGEFFKPRIYCLNKYKEDIEVTYASMGVSFKSASIGP